MAKRPDVKELLIVKQYIHNNDFLHMKPLYDLIRSLRPTKMGGHYLEVSKTLDYLINELKQWEKK